MGRSGARKRHLYWRRIELGNKETNWTERTETWLNCWSSKVLEDQKLQARHCLVLGPSWVNILFNDVDDGVEPTHRPDHDESGGAVNTPVACAAFWVDLDRLKKQNSWGVLQK